MQGTMSQGFPAKPLSHPANHSNQSRSFLRLTHWSPTQNEECKSIRERTARTQMRNHLIRFAEREELASTQRERERAERLCECEKKRSKNTWNAWLVEFEATQKKIEKKKYVFIFYFNQNKFFLKMSLNNTAVRKY